MPPIEPFYPEMGARLQAARERAGLTQKEVADRLDPPVTRASVANMESGKQRVLCHTLVALSVVLATTPESLLLGDVLPTLRAGKAANGPLDAIATELKRKVGRDVTANILNKLDGERA